VWIPVSGTQISFLARIGAALLLEHDPEKWVPVSGKIMLQQEVKAR
jgi:hypothetical protein